MNALQCLAWVPLLAVACAAPMSEVATESEPSGLVLLGPGEADLRDAFNAGSSHRQLVLILSPT